MKRWNGWGNVNTEYPLPEVGLAYLESKLGDLETLADRQLESLLPNVPETRLPYHLKVNSEPEARLRHARGQSLPDWVALNAGVIGAFPDGVAFPTSTEDVAALLAYAHRCGARVIPYGGGTSVVGHINPIVEDNPVLTISLQNLNHLLTLDETSRLVTFEAGVAGPQLEAQLKSNGYTLGHFPQSFEYSTLGGWIATRSSGQQSLYYGRIEELFAGGRVETPRGRLEIPVFPASAAGPDIREMILGSEGRMGIITHATVRVRPVPQAEAFYGVFFPSWEQGLSAVRTIIQNDIPVSMLRLSNPPETEITLVLSGKSWIDLADRSLRLVGLGDQRCLLIFGITDSSSHLHRKRGAVRSICRQSGGLYVGNIIGHAWEKNRFLSPYLRNTLWAHGVAVDTLETALPWVQVEAASQAIPEGIVQAAQSVGEQVLVMTHLSHLYRDGASIYITYLFRRCIDPEELLARWQAMKKAASQAILMHGGTISHQHGVGTDHASYLPQEKGIVGMEAIRDLCQTFDPEGMMNPGKLC